ncbi:MAG TPA: CinA family protein [Mariprofundaceae bacterium]|nr:CinA family protein [Mariprofundaceae bacterium]
MTSGILEKVEALLQVCRQRGLGLCTAESCTAGGVAAALASVAGASDVLDRGWITYSNRAKCEELGVAPELIEAHGAVSSSVVEAMAVGGMQRAQGVGRVACIAVSGIAGPGGGSKEKPVGTVWMAVAMSDMQCISRCYHFSGDRGQIQAASIGQAIGMLLEALIPGSNV